MNILNIENLSKSFTDRLLFEDASFFVQEREKVGIVGVNGTGKSTLLRIIAGEEEADIGKVISANHLVISYLSQNPSFHENASIRTNIEESLKDLNLITEAISILTRLGFTDLTPDVSSLSGGQRKKIALAIALAKPADLLLLDEPTNHLDYGMLEWLQKYLNSYRGTILMVTHDRYFLDEVCNRIVEIEQGHIYNHDTNYSGYLEEKLNREEAARTSEQKRQNTLRRELAWIRRGARARSTKQKAHIQRYEALRDIEAPVEKDKLTLSSIETRMGRTTVELDRISFAYPVNASGAGSIDCEEVLVPCGKPLIQDFSYTFLRNDRIGFIGNNGCGKTTLMKLIVGLLQPTSGSITIGQTIQLGYYSQEVEFKNDKERVIDFIRDIGEYIPTTDGHITATQMLERFLFTSDQQYSPIGKLSGGEKRRLALLSVLMTAPNVLILDEPTNDLDTETMAVLEEYLECFTGIVMTVSHDRHFLDRVVNRIFCFEGNAKISQYEGGYSDYLSKVAIPFWELNTGDGGTGSKASAGVSGKATAVANSIMSTSVPDSRSTWKNPDAPKKLKFSYKEQREYESIESEIEALENKIAELDEQMIANATNSAKLTELSQEKEALEEELMEKMERWEYLEDLAQRIKEQ